MDKVTIRSDRDTDYTFSYRGEDVVLEAIKKNNLKGVVLGISGGKDSAVVSGLMVRALGS